MDLALEQARGATASGDVPVGAVVVDPSGTVVGVGRNRREADGDPPPAWAGDPGLLEDLGLSARDLVTLVVESSSDPGTVLADVGERCGFDDQLDALR